MRHVTKSEYRKFTIDDPFAMFYSAALIAAAVLGLAGTSLRADAAGLLCCLIGAVPGLLLRYLNRRSFTPPTDDDDDEASAQAHKTRRRVLRNFGARVREEDLD